jgi:hypothetical protein
MVKPDKRQPKKPYAKPTLTVYGTLQDITLMNGPHGKMDGGIQAGAMMSHL